MFNHDTRMSIIIRPAIQGDANQMCHILNNIIAIGGTTAHRVPFDAEHMIAHYIVPENLISCAVATNANNLLGFQSLNWAQPATDKWAIIATFVDGATQGQGIGQRLFAQTQLAAKSADVAAIDATIRRENTGGLAFYSGLGFTDYAQNDVQISKKFSVFG